MDGSFLYLLKVLQEDMVIQDEIFNDGSVMICSEIGRHLA